MQFRSEVDWWYYLVIAFVCIVLATSFGPLLADPSALVIGIATLTTIVALGLPVWLLVSTHYTITDGLLLINAGPFRWSIALKEIASVEPSRSLLSSPALSLDRLAIRTTDQRTILVSPKNKEAFLDAIQSPPNM